MSVLTILSAFLMFAYPFAIYFGLQHFEIELIAIVMAVIFGLRLLVSKQANLTEVSRLGWFSGIAGLILVGLGYLFQQYTWFTFYPVVVNLLMLILFLSSFWQKQTIIERFARLQEPNLPPSGIRYTRMVTGIWCGFFIINGVIAFITCFMSLKIWTLYNGLLSYLLAGGLFISEYLVRQWVKRKTT